MPHPGHHHEPEDRWSDGSTSPGGNISRIGWLHPRRRAMRLAAAIGVVLGVLCIVLGTLALVVELGPRSPAKPGLTARILHSYKGSGGRKPKEIQVPATGHFEVDWSFSCPLGQSGTFKIADNPAAAAGNPDFSRSGASESGKWLDVGDGRPSLVVISDCRWHAKVLRPKGTPEPSHGSQHQHGTLAAHRRHKGHGYDKPGHKKAHHHRQKHSPAPADGD